MGVYLGNNAVDMQGGFTSGGSSGVKLQSKTVTPSENTQIVNPDSSYDALSSVTVEAISNTYIGSSVTTKRSNLHPEDNRPEHCIWAIPERDTNNQGRCKPGGREH